MSSGSTAPLHQAFISAVPARRAERMLALMTVLVSCVGFVAIVPFARIRLPQVDAFVPAYESALCVNALITAALLFSQSARLRSRAVLVLAAGYLFDAEIIVLHCLTFPGAFAPDGLLGAGAQTAPYLYIAWHILFPVFVLVYALLHGTRLEIMRGSARSAALSAILSVTALVVVLSAVSIVGQHFFPEVLVGDAYRPAHPQGMGIAVWFMPVVVLVVLWRRSLPTKLDLWLMVVMTAWMLDILLSVVAGRHRFDVGFYAGRSYGLLAASFMLVVLLVELNRLYADLSASLAETEARAADLARSREEFARVQRFEALGQLVGGLAHDFNNLLTVMTGSLDLIQRDPGNAMKTARVSVSALDAARRGQRLTRQLLSFARRQILRPEVVDPNHLIADLETLLRRAVGDRTQIATLRADGLWPVRLDTSEFEAALVNLVLNARDAMGGAGRITIMTRNVTLTEAEAEAMTEARAGDYAAVSVRDTGAGMPPEVIAHALEPFFTTKGIGKGSGLGLSQVYGFVSAAGGHVAIDSTPGLGTTVTMFLPRSLEPLTQETERPIPLVAARADGQETILLVEDEPTVRDVTVEGLEALGYQVRTAQDSTEALTVLRSASRIDVLFSDVMLPGLMNGSELAIEARRLRPDLKVLLTSGHTLDALREQGVRAELDVLSKPYRHEELARRLRMVIDGR